VTRRARRSAYHHGHLRRAVVDAGLAIVRRQGSAGLTLRAVAKEIGVSRQAPYHHFPDKESLSAAVAAEGFRLTTAAQQQVWDLHDDPEQRLLALGILYVTLAQANPHVFELMTRASSLARHDELADARRASDAILERAMLAFLQARPEGSMSPAVACVAALAMAHGLVRLMLEGALSPGRVWLLYDGGRSRETTSFHEPEPRFRDRVRGDAVGVA
jgi:AcrR family transcriptional regulator